MMHAPTPKDKEVLAMKNQILVTVILIAALSLAMITWGAAYAVSRGSVLTKAKYLPASDSQAHDRFGFSVANSRQNRLVLLLFSVSSVTRWRLSRKIWDRSLATAGRRPE